MLGPLIDNVTITKFEQNSTNSTLNQTNSTTPGNSLNLTNQTLNNVTDTTNLNTTSNISAMADPISNSTAPLVSNFSSSPTASTIIETIVEIFCSI